MIVKPKRHRYDNTLKILSSDAQYLFLECEVVHPPSQAGRNVTLRLDAIDGDIDAVLLACRDKAIEARR